MTRHCERSEAIQKYRHLNGNRSSQVLSRSGEILKSDLANIYQTMEKASRHVIIFFIYVVVFMCILVANGVSNDRWPSWSYWLVNVRGALCFVVFWSFTLYGKKIFKVVLFNSIIILLILIAFMVVQSGIREVKMSSFDVPSHCPNHFRNSSGSIFSTTYNRNILRKQELAAPSIT